MSARAESIKTSNTLEIGTPIHSIYQICVARWEYLSTLLEFLRTAPTEELEEYWGFQENFQGEKRDLLRNPDMEKELQDNINSYQELINLIQNPPAQYPLDHIHLKLYEFYVFEMTTWDDALKKIKKNKITLSQQSVSKSQKTVKKAIRDKNIDESPFFKDCIKVLTSSNASMAAQDFLDNHEISCSKSGGAAHEKKNWYRNFTKHWFNTYSAYQPRMEKIQLEQRLGIQEKIDSYFYAFQPAQSSHAKYEEILADTSLENETKLVEQYSLYFECYSKIENCKRIAKEIEELLRPLEKSTPEPLTALELSALSSSVSSAPTKSHRSKRKSGKEKVSTPTIIAEPLSLEPTITAPLSLESFSDLEAVDPQEDITADELLSIPSEIITEEPMPTLKVSTASKASSTKATETQLTTLVESSISHPLTNLNTKNLIFLAALYEMPHRKDLHYRDIENLIGSKPTQLAGKITPLNSSHRKIEIFSIEGYFDEVTGGIFDPHTSSHKGSLPRIVITMLRNILERAGITLEAINLALDLKNNPSYNLEVATTNSAPVLGWQYPLAEDAQGAALSKSRKPKF